MLPSETDAVAGLFAGTAGSARWSIAELAGSEEHSIRVWVAIEADEIAGAVISRDLAGEAEILNLAVAQGRRRHGIGRHLMETALEGAASAGVRRVFLEVRESNEAARALYRALDFREEGRRRAYYRDPCEDALLLWRAL